MRAAAYLRQSVDHSEGIERQRTRTLKLIEARGWDLAAEFTDNDISASKERGPHTGWGRMLDGIGRDFEVVVAVDLDRLLRSTRDLNVLIELGARVVTVDGEIDLTTADGEFRATMLAAIARFEVRRKSERQKRANEQRAAKGQYLGRHRPFGFEKDGRTPRPEECEAIRDGYRAYLAGMSLSSIARDWNARGLRTGQDGEWERTAVRAVLRNPRYVGRVRYRGQIIVDSEGVPVKAAWPAVVDEDTWEAAQAIMAGATGRKPRGRHLLTGVALCGVCGAPVQSGGNARRGVRGYRCSAALGHFARMAEPVEDFVDRVVAARLGQPDAASLIHADDASPELREQAEALRARRDGLGVALADGLLTPAQVKIATDRLNSQIAALERQLADAGRARALGDLVGAPEAYLALPADRRRHIIDLLMEVRLLPPGRGTRTFRPESVQIAWR